MRGELQGVFDEVDQDLLKSKAVSYELLRQIFELEQLIRVVEKEGRREANHGDSMAADEAVF